MQSLTALKANGYLHDHDSTLSKSPLIKFYNKINGKLPEPGKDRLVRNDDVIDAEVRYFGFFCNVTTFECDAKDALLDYQMRDSIEKLQSRKSFLQSMFELTQMLRLK